MELNMLLDPVMGPITALLPEWVLTEAREGRFDILVIGAHITPGIRSKWVDDLSEQIMLSADRPVLVFRQR